MTYFRRRRVTTAPPSQPAIDAAAIAKFAMYASKMPLFALYKYYFLYYICHDDARLATLICFSPILPSISLPCLPKDAKKRGRLMTRCYIKNADASTTTVSKAYIYYIRAPRAANITRDDKMKRRLSLSFRQS